MYIHLVICLWAYNIFSGYEDNDMQMGLNYMSITVEDWVTGVYKNWCKNGRCL